MRKPISVFDVLRQDSPRKSFVSNRFSALARDPSPAPEQFRNRTNSVKRKEPEGPSFAAVASGGISAPEPINDGLATELSTEIATVNSVCDKVAKDIEKTEADPAVIAVFNGILEAVRGISSVQTKIVANMQPKSEPVPVYTGTIPKRPRGTTATQAIGTGTGAGTVAGTSTGIKPAGRNDAATPIPVIEYQSEIETVDPKIQKFRDAIHDAERSTLVFNLDMGRVPVLNKETMSKRATLALSAMAAKVCRDAGTGNGTRPSQEAMETIDDVLSVVENMELYGKETRTYKHPSDELSGSFCTVPVRYEFHDPATKFRAEKVLRKMCGAQCTTPYPLMVRECVKQIVTVVKNRYPDNFVRVNVDTRNMVFKVARKPPKDAPNPKWQYRDEHVPIPDLALDLTLRKVPANFKLDIPATPQKSRSRSASNDMEVAAGSPGPQQNEF
jgi:hypothetical protein